MKVTKKIKIVNRFEVIDWTDTAEIGRDFVKWEDFDFEVRYDIQDKGRTLKVFLMPVESSNKKK